MEKMDKMETFKNNLEKAGFTTDFIGQALQYFNELRREGEIQELPNLIDVIDYYSKTGSFIYNTLQLFYNLHNFREDLYKVYQYGTNNPMDFLDQFDNIEKFEIKILYKIKILYTLYINFYPREEEEEEENL